jgi:hypothetical protein
MNIIEESVKKMEGIILDTGCEDGAVTLCRRATTGNCQYERGVCIESCYGGRTGEFVTDDPVEATMKISFMFGAKLTSPKLRGAACAILNALASFLCLARNVRSCPEETHAACLSAMRQKLAGKRIYAVGQIPVLESELSGFFVADPDSADIILVNNDGLVADSLSDTVNACRGRKEILCIGPSTAGIAILEQVERFCPYGT